jgi:hypothetical protein
MALTPMYRPRLSPSVERRSISVSWLTTSMKRRTSDSWTVPRTSSITSGCSGASTTKVMPKMVSGRVVYTEKDSPGCPATSMSNSAPSDRPIQFSCITRTRSGQSSNWARSSSRRWA